MKGKKNSILIRFTAGIISVMLVFGVFPGSVSVSKNSQAKTGSHLYVGYTDKENSFGTVKEAVAEAKRLDPKGEEDRVVIHIAPGVYREQIKIDSPYITFMNDDPSKEVKLTWYYGIGYKYYSADDSGFYNPVNAQAKTEKKKVANWGSATHISKRGVGFRAKNITFEASFNRYLTDEEIEDGVELLNDPSASNTTFVRRYGVDVRSKEATERSAAIYVRADKTEFYQCTFLGSQDTLFTGDEKVHSYYRECFIEGNTDYIFGDGNIVFDNCELSSYGYSSASVGGYITAAKDKSSLGYLFYNCMVTANDELQVQPGYFGRPWGAGAKVTFVNTKLEYPELICPVGWTSMSGHPPENAQFREYKTTDMYGNDVATYSRTAGTVLTQNPVSNIETYFGDWMPTYYIDPEQDEIDPDTGDEETDSENETVNENEEVDRSAADGVIAKINAIGSVEATSASMEKIETARNAYAALSEEQKLLVTNYNVLVEAETRYKSLVDEYNSKLMLTKPSPELVLANNPGIPDQDKEEAPNSKYGVLKAKVKKTTKNSNKIQWSKVEEAGGYIVLGSMCNTGGKKYPLEVLSIIDNNATTAYTHKNLAKDVYYKYIVQAYKMENGVFNIIETSKTIHSCTSSKKYANVKAVKVNKSKITFDKKGKKFKLKASQSKTGKKLINHRKLEFESSNTRVAAVNKKGKITAKGKGNCIIYIYAQNGICKQVKVKVR